jgi:ubiquitin C-terminal hydrolase
MQILSNIRELNEYIHLVSSKFQNNKSDIDVLFLVEWKSLYDLMWSKNVTISPNRFIKIIQIISKQKNMMLFSGYDQNDVTEYLYFLLDCFHNGLKKTDNKLFEKQIKYIKDKNFNEYYRRIYENNFSIIEVLFSGCYKINIIEKDTNKIISSRYDNFYMIDLQLSSTNLIECLDDYFKNEEMNEENNNQYYDDNDKCYKNVYMQQKIIHKPRILIIHLKRWNNNLRKNQRIIHFDLHTLNMDKYMEHDKNVNYNLFGIINHSGNIFGGHYYSFIKNDNNKWYNYNDTNVNEIKETNIKTNKNYVLFYRLQD